MAVIWIPPAGPSRMPAPVRRDRFIRAPPDGAQDKAINKITRRRNL